MDVMTWDLSDLNIIVHVLVLVGVREDVGHFKALQLFVMDQAGTWKIECVPMVGVSQKF